VTTTEPLSSIFAALADPTRRDMIARLAAGDATVGELAQPYGVSLQAVSKHLSVLESAGLVTKTRSAQRRTVHLEAEVFDLATKWLERYRREAEARYRRLDAVLEDLAHLADLAGLAEGSGEDSAGPTRGNRGRSTRTGAA
jgi:DNA-binding transcriptional ArsR family regulator